MYAISLASRLCRMLGSNLSPTTQDSLYTIGQDFHHEPSINISAFGKLARTIYPHIFGMVVHVVTLSGDLASYAQILDHPRLVACHFCGDSSTKYTTCYMNSCPNNCCMTFSASQKEKMVFNIWPTFVLLPSIFESWTLMKRKNRILFVNVETCSQDSSPRRLRHFFAKRSSPSWRS